jgi:YebC/PmpR family DNA-binding regulatory protein
VPDPKDNSRLRLAIASAKAESMPKDNIERAIKKAQGGEVDTYEEIRYEGFGPGGVGLIVEVLTDNRNRAAANVRTIFGKNGGALGETGSVAFMFDRLGQIVYPLATASEDAMMEAAIEAGAEDVVTEEDAHTVFTAFEDLSAVADALETRFGAPKSTAIVWRPKSTTPVAGDQAAGLIKLLDALDDDDDVQTVFSNEDIGEADLAQLNG